MPDCAECPAPDRRRFLSQVTGAVAGIMAALAATPREAVALPLALVTGREAEAGSVSYPIPSADGVTVDREHEVILVRWKSAVYAFALSCPHQHTALKWLAAPDARFQCPKHKSRYQPDGSFISGRATRHMDRYAIRKAGKTVVVNLGQLYRNDQQAGAWGGAKVVV